MRDAFYPRCARHDTIRVAVCLIVERFGARLLFACCLPSDQNVSQATHPAVGTIMRLCDYESIGINDAYDARADSDAINAPN